MTLLLAGAGVVAGIVGSWWLYLASPQQQWRSRGPWPARARAWPASLSLLLSLILLLQVMGALAATFAWVIVVMLVGSAAPFLGAWRAHARRRSP